MEVGYVIVLHPLVIKEDIPRLDVFWRHEIRDTIRAKLSTQPELYGKPLRQSLAGYRSLRIGDYRAIFRVEKKYIHVLAVMHRSEVYKLILKRL